MQYAGYCSFAFLHIYISSLSFLIVKGTDNVISSLSFLIVKGTDFNSKYHASKVSCAFLALETIKKFNNVVFDILDPTKVSRLPLLKGHTPL